MKVYYSLLIIMFVLIGCLRVTYREKCPPLRWHGEGKYHTNIELNQRHIWSIGIRASEKDLSLLSKLSDFDVTSTVVNKGGTKLTFFWKADCEEEKQAGNLSAKYEGWEERKIALKPNEKLVWYVGKMGGLVNEAFLHVQNYENGEKKWKIFLQLEFKNPERLKKIKNVKDLGIPVSARSADNI